MALTPEMIADIRGTNKPQKTKGLTPEMIADIKCAIQKSQKDFFTAEEIAEIEAVGAKTKARQQDKYCGKLLSIPKRITMPNRYNTDGDIAMSSLYLYFVFIAIAFFTHILRKPEENIFKSMLRGVLFTLIPLFVLLAYIMLLVCHMKIACLDWDGNIIDEIYFVYNMGGFIAVFIVSFLLMLFVYRENKK